jgi:hypothetical protein
MTDQIDPLGREVCPFPCFLCGGYEYTDGMVVIEVWPRSPKFWVCIRCQGLDAKDRVTAKFIRLQREGQT